MINTVLTVFFWYRISHKQLCILFRKYVTWSKIWHWEIFGGRVSQVSTRIQKSPAVRNDKRRIVIAKNDNALIHLLKERMICTSQEKEINPTLKVLVLSCFFVSFTKLWMAGRNCPWKCESSVIIRIEVSIEGTLVNRMENKKSRSLVSLPIYC